MILGTAGHIDHGKTALVRALTGVDTDRLPEEKRRGITIDLGFAPLRLDNGTVLGVVDVPGHEAFVRTMLAGASGVDLALLIIAADEGPMPQTREHLSILELLGVREVIVALTKVDLVDADWLGLVTDDISSLLQSTPFAKASIIPTSVITNQGIHELRTLIGVHADRRAQRAAENRPGAAKTLAAPAENEVRAPAENEVRAPAESEVRAPAENDVFRLPIDRAFTIKGTGTVVTGTVWSGTLAADDTVRVMPSGATARVRGVQNHGAPVPRLAPGMRAAVALSGVDVQALSRGATLVTHAAWEATQIVRADLTLLPEAPELRPRTRVRFHLATADVGARVVAAGSPVSAGTTRAVRIVLDEPVIARGGDRFVIRSASPLATIGGGVITDANGARRARPMPRLGMSPEARLALMVAESGTAGLPDALIPVRIGVRPSRVSGITVSCPGIERIGERWYDASVLADAADRIVALVQAHHAARPLDTGMPRQDARSRLRLDAGLFDYLVARLVSQKRLDAAGAELRVHGWAPALSNAQSRATDDLVAALAAAGTEPPSVAELQERFGPQTLSLLRHLERGRLVVQVEDARYYSPDAVKELLRRLEQGMAGRGELAPTDLREMLGVSRKFLIPFLEYCDKRGYTARVGNGRVWRGIPASS